VKAWALADEHNVGLFRTFAGYGVVASLAQDALLTDFYFRVQIGEFRQSFAPFASSVMLADCPPATVYRLLLPCWGSYVLILPYLLDFV
jgi:hypothetical protein